MTRFNVHRFAVLAIGAVTIFALSATSASAAPAAKPKAPTIVSPVQTTDCRPASAMTGAERAALPSLRVCLRGAGAGSGAVTPRLVQPDASVSGTISKITSVAAFISQYSFESRYEVTMSQTTLKDVNCDGRSVYADLKDNNEFIAEYTNGLGCNKTATYPDEYYYDNDGMHWITITVYACNIVSCSTPQTTQQVQNGRWV